MWACMPTMPHSAAGCRTDPPVSDAERHGREPGRDSHGRSAARSAGNASTCPTDCSMGPNAECSVDEPIANSSQLVLPMTTAPSASRRSTAVAEYGGAHIHRGFASPPSSACRERTSLSLMRDGHAVERSVASRRVSSARARSIAPSASTVMKALRSARPRFDGAERGSDGRFRGESPLRIEPRECGEPATSIESEHLGHAEQAGADFAASGALVHDFVTLE